MTLQADQPHAAPANLHVIHHGAAGRKLGDRLAVGAGACVDLAAYTQLIEILANPTGLEALSSHLPFDERQVADCGRGITGA